MADQDRCWPGYEPVKGKKQHEQGSCRPKAESKSTGPEKKFRAKRRKQLDKWEAEHPHTRKSAAQHLRPPAKKKAAAKKAVAKKTEAKKAVAKKAPAKKSASKAKKR